MTNEINVAETAGVKTPKKMFSWLVILLLVCILATGAFLRFTGINWDEDQHLHPDERFLTMVSTAIEPVQHFGEYFDTENSSLNPHNRGYTFYVYGTLPLFAVRYVGEWMEMTGYGDIHLVGRALSAMIDLLTVFLVFLTGERLYNRRIGLLAAAFAAVMVVPIQQSHFYTVDTFASFFMMLAIYLAVIIAANKPVEREAESGARQAESNQPLDVVDLERASDEDRSILHASSAPDSQPARRFYAHPLFWSSILFGLVLGMAVASKINAAPIAVVLPLAAGLYLFKLSPIEQRRQAPRVFAYLVMAGVVSILSFRIFQPYAFSGPGFFGIIPNQAWVENIKALRAQTSGDVDFPPALQWARRPLSFSWQNMVLWGLGLPLGLLAWTGFLYMAWRIFKGEWQKHILLWGWTAAYFTWQSIQWNSTLRYQLPIYPLLAIIAAWFVITLYDRGQQKVGHGRRWKWLAIGLGGFVLIASTVWAYAFSGIYPQDHTRIEASRWLFQEMPGPITLSIEQDGRTYHQPLVFHEGLGISQEQRYDMGFEARASGELASIYFPHIVDKRALSENTTISVGVDFSPGEQDPIAAGQVVANLEEGPSIYTIPLDMDISMAGGQIYYISLDISPGESEIEICSPFLLQFRSEGESEERELNLPLDCLSRYDLPISLTYSPQKDGDLEAITLQFTELRETFEAEEQVLRVDFLIDPNNEPVATGTIISDFAPGSDGDERGQSYRVELDQPVAIEEGNRYFLRFTLVDSPGNLSFYGTAPANESSWDDGLPLRIDGYDPYGGIYEGDLNFEMYWDDNEEKYERFVTTLDRADYVLISSSRQWGTTTRVPERYPLTTEYYRNLIGCPLEEDIEWCYNVAEEDTFEGRLGFDLVKIFVSNPSVGTFAVNDQPAEEAFTVYDHPKVLVFKKSDDYDPEQVREILGAVDLSKVIHITPKQADDHPGNLMLPPDRLIEQRSGGTWSALFDYESTQNKYPLLTVVIWYLAVTLLGWLVYPFVRFAMPGLADRGYPLIRMVGLLLLSYLVWMAGSVQIPSSRLTIGIALGLIAILSAVLAYYQRNELKEEWREKRKYFLMVEFLTLGFFIFGLLVRFGNPDLWHPWKGGEKPMDFSYFNAVIKSTSFPPYDPWFAGGYINYYYYGFMIVGVLVKFLGIVPSIAYNLILPSLLSMIAMGAFSVGWNLLSKSCSMERSARGEKGEVESVSVFPTQPNTADLGTLDSRSSIPKRPFYTGLIAAFLMAVFGNLGTLRMILDGFKINGAPIGEIEGASFFSRVLWTFQGAFDTITGAALPYRMDEWYWNPSRVIGAEHGGPITEFPYFTFLYGDLHAHLIALPIALLAIAWALSVVQGKAWRCDSKRSVWRIGVGLFLGGLIVGALYPVNLSDIYTYLPLGVVALTYAIWFYGDAANRKPDTIRRVIFLIGAVGIFTLLALFLYKPYADWYGQGYSEIQLWKGTRTPVMDYLTHWGAFIFIFLAWMIHETIDWMASTPVSALRKLMPYRGLILGLLAVILALIAILGINLYPDGLPADISLPLGIGVHVIWFVLPLSVWAGVLLLRPGISDAKRFTFFLVGTGIILTLMVEIIVVSGDIGRMNTVFKFYLHVWALFSVSAAAAIMWMSQSLAKWKSGWRFLWQIGLVFFVGSMLLYPLTATLAKVRDRMATDAPHTLDGMTYMKYATHADEGADMDLSQDYNAIRWMQDNIEGSPVIVEAHLTEYRWGTRYTIYTGLPGVVGWNWHQRQQRTLLPESWVWDRVNAIGEFYETTDLDYAIDFLNRYDVSFIVVGQLERAKYSPDGIVKFEAQNGILWNEVFRDRDTVIYQVVRSEP
jgi:YYY domain-containing protein